MNNVLLDCVPHDLSLLRDDLVLIDDLLAGNLNIPEHRLLLGDDLGHHSHFISLDNLWDYHSLLHGLYERLGNVDPLLDGGVAEFRGGDGSTLLIRVNMAICMIVDGGGNCNGMLNSMLGDDGGTSSCAQVLSTASSCDTCGGLGEDPVPVRRGRGDLNWSRNRS